MHTRDELLTHNHYWSPTHDVQFYDRDESLVANVGRFLAEGVRLGQPIVVFATPSHRAAFAARMRDLGIDPDSLTEGRNAAWLDARATLSAFMEGSRPNRELFEVTVGRVFQKTVANRSYVVVRAFGEMVDLLWRDNMAQAAIVLEELWNDLAARYPFALVCGYSMDGIRRCDDGRAMERICGQHAKVVPRIA